MDALKLDATDQPPVNRVVRQARPASAAAAAASSASAAVRQPQSWLRYYVPAAGLQHPTYGAERVRAEVEARANQALVVPSTSNHPSKSRHHSTVSQPTTSSAAQPQAHPSMIHTHTHTNTNTAAGSTAAVPDFLRRPPKPEAAARDPTTPTPAEAAVAAAKRTAVAAAAAASARPPKPRRPSSGGGASTGNVSARSERSDGDAQASGRHKAVSAEVSEIGREIGLDAAQQPEVKTDRVVVILLLY